MYSHSYNAGRQIPKVRQSDAADYCTSRGVCGPGFVSNELRLCNRIRRSNERPVRVLHLDFFLSDL